VRNSPVWDNPLNISEGGPRLVSEPLQTCRKVDSTATVARESPPRVEDDHLDLRHASVALAAGRAIAEWDEFVASGATRHFRGSPERAGSLTPPVRRDSARFATREIPEERRR